MSRNREISHKENRTQGERREVTTSDVARFLKRLSQVYRDPTTGNPALADALADLAMALRRQKGLTISEAIEVSVGASSRDTRTAVGDLRNIELAEAKDLLSDTSMTKSYLMKLGKERFGISESVLKRLSAQQVVEEIWSAIRHEESLSIISREAQRSGTERS